MKQRFILMSLAVFTLFSILPSRVIAESVSQTHGLFISPLRQYLKANTNTTVQSSLTVSNLTNKSLNVHLSVQQFSLTDYTYDYRFTQPANNWLHINTPDFTLQPLHTQTISYSLDIPTGTAPGGYYYTLLASANLANQGINSTIQAADLLYLTVNGKLIYTSKLQTSSISRFSFGRPFTYRLNTIDTGNVYFFAYTTGSLRGRSARPAATSAAHMLVPGVARNLSGDITTPILPGIYSASYGYRTDTGQNVMQKSMVVFIPPWSVAFLLALLLVIGSLLRNRHTRKRSQAPSESSSNQS